MAFLTESVVVKGSRRDAAARRRGATEEGDITCVHLTN